MMAAVAPSDRPAAVVARRLYRGLGLVALVLVVGTVGYVMLGFPLIDAAYQAVTTVTTIGFREVVPFGTSEKIFTMVYALTGVGAILYTLTTLLETLVEGHLGDLWGRRRMERDIDRLTGHTIVCGWGRVGRAASHQMAKAGQRVVVVDLSADRLSDCPYPHIHGDATLDQVLRRAGIERARTLVAAVENDATSVYVVLSARVLAPGLTVIARSRTDDGTKKLERAGADRVVNPQRIGGDRIAAFALQPHVVDFLDVAMRDSGVEFRMEEVTVGPGSALAGRTVRDTRSKEGGGALLLALRGPDGAFQTNPASGTVISPGDVVIVVGTGEQVAQVRSDAAVRR